MWENTLDFDTKLKLFDLTMYIQDHVLAAQNNLRERLPVHIIMRLFIVGGVWLRFFSGQEMYSVLYARLWIFALLILSTYTITFALWVLKNPKIQFDLRWCFVQVLADTMIFSCLYVLTGRPYSDFYLFYFLPLLVAAERFNAKQVSVLFLFVSIFFIVALILLNILHQTGLPISTIIINNALPRWFFFLFVIFLAFMRGNILKQKSEELEAVYKTSLRITKNEALQPRLESILDAAIELLNAKGCKVYLKIPNQKALKLVALKGVVSTEFQLGYILPLNTGLAGKVFECGQPIIENDYQNSPYKVPELAELFEAIVEVPLMLDEPIGVLGVFDDGRRRVFLEKDIKVLERLAQYASVAIRDIQQVEQLQKQTEALRVLYLASEALINANLDIDETLSRIVEHVWKLTLTFSDMPPLFTYFALLDAQEQYLDFKAAYPTEQLTDLRVRIGRIDLRKNPIGIIGRAIRSGVSLNISNVALDSDYFCFNANTKSQLTVLAKGKRKVVGVITIEHPNTNAFSTELQEKMELMAAQAATAIENAQLFEQNEVRRALAERLRQATVAVSSSNKVHEAGYIILESLHTLIPFNRATLQRIDGDRRHLVAKYNLNDENIDTKLLRPISQDKLIGKIVNTKSILILPLVEYEETWQPFHTTSDIRSWMGIPLVYGDKVIGLITLDNIDQDIYKEDQRDLLELFATHAASAFQNALLFQQLTERVDELTRTKDYLESLLQYLEEHRNLALIGLVYGETIHHARNKLGMAKTIAANILQGEYGEDIQTIQKHTERLIRHINDYLQALNEAQQKALQTPSPTPLNVHHSLDHVVNSKQISSLIEIKKIYKANNPIVSAPERQLRQVFYVIVQNALDAMTSGQGLLTLTTDIVNYEDKVFFLVIISDTGVGIEPDKQDALFEAKLAHDPLRAHRGTGMGLIWARSFIRSYGGDIYFTSTPRKGTTMYIRIPQDFREPVTLKRELG